MIKVGETVKCGDSEYVVVAISDEPYLEFDDSSKHYVLSIHNDKTDLFVNDTQIELIKNKEREWIGMKQLTNI